eukprot:NODE_22_length_42145_cov_1.310612.p19 type:complete len:289 gc:universal NODE_22_length_42145_cov_1.310612:30372-29506(-)
MSSFKIPFLHSTFAHVPHLLDSELPNLKKIIYLSEIMDYDKLLQFPIHKLKSHIVSLYNPKVSVISTSARKAMSSKHPKTILCVHKQGTQFFEESFYYDFVKSNQLQEIIQLYDPLHYKRKKHLSYLENSLECAETVYPVVMLSDIGLLNEILHLYKTKPLKMIIFENDTDHSVQLFNEIYNKVKNNGIVPYLIRLSKFEDVLFCRSNNIQYDTYSAEHLTSSRKFIVDTELVELEKIAISNGKEALMSGCKCEGCFYSAYYIHHLVKNRELLAEVCLMHHNITQLIN